MTAAEEGDELREVVNLDISTIDRSPFNRKHFDERRFVELVESVRVHGVLQPILVRPRARGRYELVFGERRWLACGRAGRRMIPAFIQAMDDQAAILAQAVENDQREDIHPLDQAEAYHRLHSPPAGADYAARSVEEIASKVGRSPAYVRQRLRLVALGEKARRAFWANELDVSVAHLLARIPNEKLQEQALTEVTRDKGMTFDEAKAHVRDRYMLLISGAPFDTTDEKLVDDVGPCTTCPKRSGNQRELFGDITKNDVCTDRHCYQKKVEAHWRRLRVEAEKKGVEVIDGKRAKALFPYGSSQLAHDAAYVDLDDVCHEDPKSRTYGKLLGRRAPKALALDPEGHIRHLAAKDKVRQALKQAGHNFRRVATVAGADRALKRERQRMKKAQETTETAIGQIVEACGTAEVGSMEMLLVENVMRIGWAGSVKATVARRGWTEKGHTAESIARERLAGDPTIDRLAFVLEVLLQSNTHCTDGKVPPHVIEAAKKLGVDRKPAEKVEAEPAA